MRMGRLQIIFVSVLGIALVAAVGMIFLQSRWLAEVQRQREADQKTLKEARVALHQCELRYAAAAAKPRTPEKNEGAAIAQRDAKINQLNSAVNEARASITQLQEQLAHAKNENQQALASADEHYKKLQANWQSRLDSLQQEVDAAQDALQDTRQRIASLETANAKLRSEKGANSARDAERQQLLANLQDLDRRREVYLSSIADRYRDVTNRFRTMSGMLDSNREEDSSAFSGAALDLIQNTISLAEDDLRHLSELNAKAFQLEKKLAKKK